MLASDNAVMLNELSQSYESVVEHITELQEIITDEETRAMEYIKKIHFLQSYK